MSESATPKQIAYLDYMGVSRASQMTKEEASQAIDSLFSTSDPEEWERLDAKRKSWATEKFIRFPDLYASELREHLNACLPDELHTYVRSRSVGSSERLTKAKIREVVLILTEENHSWWIQPGWKETFYERLKTNSPGCCDGSPPVRTDKQREKRSRVSDSHRGSEQTEEIGKVPVSGKGAGCLTLVASVAGFVTVGILYFVLLIWGE